MTRSLMFILLSCLIALLVRVASGDRAASLPERGLEAWSERLEALDPARPLEYFELGEEVEDQATSPEERALARQLFGLAGLLDRQRLGSSAALAIANLEARGIARDRLRAAAKLLTPPGTPNLSVTSAPALSEAGRLAFCNALAALRRGDGGRARRHLGTADSIEVLEALGPLLPGGVAGFERDLEYYDGGQRPDLTESEIEAHLVVELNALEPETPGWAASLRATGAAPLLVVDLEQLDRLFAVDPTRPWWREGAWVGRRELGRPGR